MSSCQWLTSYYPMGKTSTASILNIPGRIAWMTMELPGPLILVYAMHQLLARSEASGTGPSWAALPWQNKLLAGLFLLHYAHRAVLYPLLQPSIAPIHALVWSCAVLFQLLNATCLASWLVSYGPVTASDWGPSPSSASSSAAAAASSESFFLSLRFAAGLLLFFAGLAGNIFHDEELRRIRRRLGKHDKKNDEKNDEKNNDERNNDKKTQGSGGYEVPQASLFSVVLYPHYLCEWLEWLGFWVAAGTAVGGCVPARAFLQNEVVAMLPRAVRGRAWYVARFGEAKIGRRRAIIPGLL
ncbi:Uncharacterized protein ESCO_003395 [Escovopsis weberi]|uniref:3-oxo-5-alpha-steroid 4-dehydrogenase C-terminal domain-containing protein n=1 Tax=Escovopsis weberi TaxID=150374 RepID=A0A0M8N923_ESCWE|nr:Uncharacterized protein ESCO_003395 [Escovopsis weberi]